MDLTFNTKLNLLKGRFTAWRERGAAKKIEDFFYSPLFIYITGIQLLGLYILGIDELSFSFLILTGCTALVFCRDIMPCSTLLLFGCITKSLNNRDYQKFTNASYAVLAAVGVIAFLCLCFHFIINFKVSRFRNCRLLLGFALLSAGFVTNGFFFKEYTYKNLAAALAHIGVFAGTYLVIRAGTRTTRESLRYFSYSCMMCGLIVCVQLCLAYFFNKPFISSGFAKDKLHVGWGMSNSVGTMLFRCMPLCFYLAATEKKYNWIYFVAATLMVVAQVFTYARSAMLFTLPVYAACYIISCIVCRNRLQLIICGGVCIVLGSAALALGWSRIVGALKFFIDNGLSDRGRFNLWNRGMGYFKKHPVFGVGLMYEFKKYFRSYTYYHNTIIQFTVTGGIAGILTYLFHRMQVLAMFTQRLTLPRLFLGLMLAGILLISLLGCQYMYMSAHAFIAPLLVIAEDDLAAALPFAYSRRSRLVRRLF